jgi:hypothetical protein
MKTMESSRLLARAKSDVGKLSTRHDPGTDHGNLGCADAVTRILHDGQLIKAAKNKATPDWDSLLVAAGGQPTPNKPTTRADFYSFLDNNVVDQSHVDAIKREADHQREQISKTPPLPQQ